jgi:aminomethyltransferase
MKAASQGQIDDTIKYFQSGFFDIGGQSLYVSRTGFTGELGFEIYCDAAKTDHLSLWDHLINSGEEFGMEVSSTRAMTMRRIEAGILGNTTDMDIQMTPFEVGFSQFVDLDKEGFVGRDALVKKKKDIRLLGATCETRIPAAESKIIDRNKIVGQIRAGVPSPTLGLGIGYAHFYDSGEWCGKNLELRFQDGTRHRIEIVDLPFFDKTKKIVKGDNLEIPEINNSILRLIQ